MSTLKVWQYKIPSGPLGGWAEIMIREDGFFSTVSDYGNYSYCWTATGCSDVRQFFLRPDWDYFAKKFNPRRVVDDEASFKCLQKAVEKDEDATPEEIAERVAHIKDFEIWDEFLRDDETSTLFEDWAPWEYSVTNYESDVTNFTKLVMPQLAELIRAELQQEAELQREALQEAQQRLVDKDSLF